jgi:hypothetical protein
MMLFTCKTHVINGLKRMDVPHIKRLHIQMDDSCYFCKKEADYNLFYSLPFYRIIRKKNQVLHS